MRKLLVLAIAAAITLPGMAADSHRTPGLWQVTTSVHFSQGGIQIPPAVRQQMEAHGMKIPDMTKPNTFKHCLTPEEAARDEQPQFSNDKSCKATQSQWTGDHFHAEFSCSGHGGPSHGEVDGTISAGGKAYTGTFRMEGDNPQMGGHYVMEGNTSGKWLGATCDKDAS